MTSRTIWFHGFKAKAEDDTPMTGNYLSRFLLPIDFAIIYGNIPTTIWTEVYA